MTQENKFEYQVTQNGEQWDAKITRRVTARKTATSKQKKGFSNEADAIAWGKETLAGYIENLQLGNKRKGEKRTERIALAEKQEAEKEAAAIAYQEKRQAAREAMDAAEFEDDSDEQYEEE